MRPVGSVRGAATGTAGLRTFVINTPGPMGQGGGAEREGSGRGEVAAGEGQKKCDDDDMVADGSESGEMLGRRSQSQVGLGVSRSYTVCNLPRTARRLSRWRVGPSSATPKAGSSCRAVPPLSRPCPGLRDSRSGSPTAA
jgi:hypothetical protein